MVSQLFLTSITSNRKDLVELTMDRLENIEAFVFDKIANIYWRVRHMHLFLAFIYKFCIRET